MTDRDALLHAILADPDDDTARLVFADFIEEAGEGERAAFIRDQVELGRTPEWEPFAVRCRRADLATQAGDRFRSSLPWADGWNPRFPFRRGFGYAVKTDAVRHLLEHGRDLFASAPIGELHLPAGDMDEFRTFARESWLPAVRSVVFWTLTSPTHPVRALCESPLSTGIESIHFHTASSPGMWSLVEGLFQSPIGRQLRELSFRVGDGSQLDLIEAFEAGGPPRLARLVFDNMGLDTPSAERLARSPVFDTLTDFTLKDMFMNQQKVRLLLRAAGPGLQSLTLANVSFQASNHNCLTALSARKWSSLRRLNLAMSYGLRDALPAILVKSLAGLRSLNLSRMNLDDSFISQLVRAPFWPNLVELDLSENQLSDSAGRHLLAVAPPKDLVTLDLRGRAAMTRRMREQLREHYAHSLMEPEEII